RRLFIVLVVVEDLKHRILFSPFGSEQPQSASGGAEQRHEFLQTLHLDIPFVLSRPGGALRTAHGSLAGRSLRHGSLGGPVNQELHSHPSVAPGHPPFYGAEMAAREDWPGGLRRAALAGSFRGVQYSRRIKHARRTLIAAALRLHADRAAGG